ncbi:MAG: hypothetical protein GEU92_17640 [Alphaproteobacteria bacterium]|nr:hypothetical protein [Alphaproteobacteria bacterium]
MEMSFRIHRAAAIGVAAALAGFLPGCSGNMVTVSEDVSPAPSYYDGDFEYATRNGAIRTEVIGQPFVVTPDTLKARVLHLMDGQNRGVATKFVATNGNDTDPAFKVVAAFNLSGGYSGRDLCRGTAGLPSRGAGTPITLDMAFCIGDQLKTEVQGRVGVVSGLDDPKFAALVRQTTLGLIPPQDGHGGDGDSANPD